MIIDLLRSLLYEPRVRNIDVDDDELLAIHASILQGKPLLRSAFETFYLDMAARCDQHFRVPGIEVELGTGAGFFRKLRPSLLTSDVRRLPGIDLTLNAQSMELEDSSVRCIYAINVFHHLSDPILFFNELIRVLRPGGGCILIEPHGGFSSALLHRYLHRDEHFDPKAADWHTPDMGGPMSGANQALADIVFRRDLDRFKSQYSGYLEVLETGYELNSLRYLLSGGLNFRQLVPSFMDRPLAMLEQAGRPLARHWSLHQTIVLRRLKD